MAGREHVGTFLGDMRRDHLGCWCVPGSRGGERGFGANEHIQRFGRLPGSHETIEKIFRKYSSTMRVLYSHRSKSFTREPQEYRRIQSLEEERLGNPCRPSWL